MSPASEAHTLPDDLYTTFIGSSVPGAVLSLHGQQLLYVDNLQAVAIICISRVGRLRPREVKYFAPG